MSMEKSFFSRINDLVKPYRPNDEINQLEYDNFAKIKEYLDTLPLDKRKIAVGGDIFMWYFDTFSREDSVHKSTDGYRYGDNPQEITFMIKNPAKTLLSHAVWSMSFMKTIRCRWFMKTIRCRWFLQKEQLILIKPENQWNGGISKHDTWTTGLRSKHRASCCCCCSS